MLNRIPSSRSRRRTGRRSGHILSLGFLILALATCGSETKKEPGKQPEKEKQVEDKAPAKPGTEVAVTSAPGQKSLFGGRFAGVLGGLGAAAPSMKIDLSTAFSKNLPNLAPQMAQSMAAIKDSGLTKELWALTPANAAFGMVVGDGTIAKLTGSLQELKRLLSARPGGAQIVEQMRAAAAGDLGIDIFDPTAWSRASGLDLSKGAAMFVSPAGEALVVIPVVDVAAFQTALDKENNLGAEHCVMAGSRYVCAENLDYAKAAVAPHDSPLATRVAGLPGWLRGDVELVAHLRSFPNAAEGLAPLAVAMADIGTLALAGRIENGSLTLRGWLEGRRSGPVGDAFAQIPQATLQALSGGAANWYHMRLPMGFIFSQAPDMPASIPLPGGIDLRPDLLDNLTGEIAVYSRGKNFLAEHIVFGLKEPARLARAMPILCEGIKAQGFLGQVKQQGASCQGVLDLRALLADAVPELAPFVDGMPPVEILAAVNGNALELQVGKLLPPSGKAGDNAGTAVAQEMMTGEWNGVQWGVAFDPLAITPPVLTERLDKNILANLTPDQIGPLNLLRWMYAHVYDAGVAMALRADGMYLTAQITTYAADPPEALKAYEDALALLYDRNYAGYKSAIAALAQKHPQSLAGRNAALQVKGVPMFGQAGAIGVLAAVAIIKKQNED